MADPVLPADQKFRKKVIITLFIALPVGIGLLYGFWIYFHHVSTDTNIPRLITRMQTLIFWIAVVNVFVSSFLCLYLVFMSMKTFKFKMFPPPGTRVIYDTKIRTGRSAVIFGILLIAAALLVLSTNMLMYFLHHILNGLMRQVMP